MELVFKVCFKPKQFHTNGRTGGSFGGRKYHQCSWSLRCWQSYHSATDQCL